ncbi:type I pantothenate kinase, partial [Burkholderia multivorans]
MPHVDPQLDRARRLAGLNAARKLDDQPSSPFWEFDREV